MKYYKKGCRVCGSNEPLNQDKICSICATVRSATKARKSYGQYVAENGNAFVYISKQNPKKEKHTSKEKHISSMDDEQLLKNVKYPNVEKGICIICHSKITDWRRKRRTCSHECANKWNRYIGTYHGRALFNIGYYESANYNKGVKPNE